MPALDLLHKKLIRLADRAERIPTETLANSFVDARPLFDMLSTQNNQILYGRRGTGKTHLLKYLSSRVQAENELPVYLDLREVGSNGSLYADPSRPFAERATQLIQDVLCALHDEILKIAVENIDHLPNPAQVTSTLDDLAAECTRTRIQGTASVISQEDAEAQSHGKLQAVAKAGSSPEIGASAEKGQTLRHAVQTTRSLTGIETPTIVFGSLQQAIRRVIETLGITRLWVLLDEWSVIPIELQPYMADIIRRCMFPIERVTVKFGAIEHRSNFKIPLLRGQYIGLEVGADASADLNLDDFMVFDNDSERSKEFFGKLVYNHVMAGADGEELGFSSPAELVSMLFNQTPTFEEFVRASEGVPRDALHLLGIAVSSNFGNPITMPIIRTSASTWYTRDKTAAATENNTLNDFLQKIILEVIGHRKARAFLFRADVRSKMIDDLFDLRLVHILKRNISSHDNPGIRYHAYKLDYGCYVNLINTSQATRGLLNIDEGQYVDVPPDDWRSIRRAILEPEEMVVGE